MLGVDASCRQQAGDALRASSEVTARRAALATAPRYVFEVAVVGALVLIVVFTACMQNSVAAAVPVHGMFGSTAMRLLPAITSLLNRTNEMRANRGV